MKLISNIYYINFSDIQWRHTCHMKCSIWQSTLHSILIISKNKKLTIIMETIFVPSKARMYVINEQLVYIIQFCCRYTGIYYLGYQDENLKLISQKCRAWSDCTDVHDGLTLYRWQRLITFSSSRIVVYLRQKRGTEDIILLLVDIRCSYRYVLRFRLQLFLILLLWSSWCTNYSYLVLSLPFTDGYPDVQCITTTDYSGWFGRDWSKKLFCYV